jgi:amidophosphoribosyltransferase
MYGLQHRGQASAGLTVMKDGEPHTVKDLGIVSTVCTEANLKKLPNGEISVAHLRYTTLDYLDRAASQPLVMRYIEGSMALANNGSITNFPEIRNRLEQGGSIFQSNSHAEIIGFLIATNMINSDTIEDAILSTMNDLKGAYSMVISSPSKLIGLRDPHGFKPLCIGKLKNSYMISSESCAIESIGGTFIRDIEPGEMVVIDSDGFHSYHSKVKKKTSLCLFEYVYLARPDSVIDGVDVNVARKKAGEILYRENPVRADIVCGVPDSGLTAAQGYSAASGIEYATAFIKNKYIGRTPAALGNDKKERLLNMRLNVLKNVVDGKRVVIIDDSIVRGNTSAHIVKILRQAGAKEVHMRISSPPFMWPCYYGTDIPSRGELIACNHTIEEITKLSGADSLGYLPVECLSEMLNYKNVDFCDGCFTGKYPADITHETFKGKERGGMNFDKDKKENCQGSDK